MKSIFIGLILAIGLGFGCGSNEGDKAKTSGSTNSTGSNSSSSSGNPLTAPVDYLGAAAKARNTATRVTESASLTQAIQLFYAQEERYPKDLNELVTKRYIGALPTPPPGKKFQYNPSNGELKI